MTTENIADEKHSSESTSLTALARKVLLAGIGAVALAQEEAEAFIHKLIEKGEIAEKDGRVIIKDFHEKRRDRAEKELDKLVESIVNKLDVPTKSDIQVLSEKIAEIVEKIDDLESKSK
jgi:polyhydroxyalkanoate synthesis regulator phasin